MKTIHHGLEFPYVTEVYGDIPCTDPALHKEHGWHNTPEGCVWCYGKWEETLPWVRPSYEKRRFEDDEAVLSLLSVRDDVRKMKRRTATYRNCWKHLGAGYEDYVMQTFGIEIGESKDPDSYPYWRIAREDKPNMIIPLLRERICYEPTMRELPVYIEIARQGLWRDISFHGLSDHCNLSMISLRPILFAYNCLFEDFEARDEMFDNQKLREKFKGFIAAAERLGEKRERFSIPNLCKNYGANSAGYKSRDSYYSFRNAVKDEYGAAKVERAEKMIREAYELATMRPDTRNGETQK